MVSKRHKINFGIMNKYDYFIKDLSKDRKDPAFKAYVPKADAYVYGENFAELQAGIELVLEGKKSSGDKYKISKTSVNVNSARINKK